MIKRFEFDSNTPDGIVADLLTENGVEDVFERVVQFLPAWDRRDEGKGQHGVELWMHLRGTKGAVSFRVLTGWTLDCRSWVASSGAFRPTPATVTIHSPRPLSPTWEVANSSCDQIGGVPCYSDSSYTGADDVFKVLLNEGSEGVWRVLREWYKSHFEKESA